MKSEVQPTMTSMKPGQAVVGRCKTTSAVVCSSFLFQRGTHACITRRYVRQTCKLLLHAVVARTPGTAS